MHIRSGVISTVVALLFLPTAALVPTALAQAPRISQAEDQCIVRVQYPMLVGEVDSRDLPVVRLYFRAEQHPDLYWVRMVPTATGFEAIIPVPAQETTRIVYSIEAVGPDFTTTRTADFTAEVVATEEACEDRALLFRGADPNIVLTTTTPAAAAIPPGFEAAGIAGTVTGPAAVAAATTPGWLLPVAIAGGFGSVLLLDALDDDDDEPVSPVLP